MDSRTIQVRKRFGDEILDVREFVRPNTLMVRRLYAELRGRSRNRVEYLNKCWSYVVHRIKYPPGPQSSMDWHGMAAYRNQATGAPILQYQVRDYWNFPSETIRDGWGDCDDKAILLVSLLRWEFRSGEVFASVGRLDGHGHMWVAVRDKGQWIALETTKPQAAMPELPHYISSFRFNDKAVIASRAAWHLPDFHTGVLARG